MWQLAFCCTVSVKASQRSSPNSKRMIDTALFDERRCKELTTISIYSSPPFGHRYQTYKTHFTVSRSPKSLLSLTVKFRSRISSFPSSRHKWDSSGSSSSSSVSSWFRDPWTKRQVFCPYVPSIQWWGLYKKRRKGEHIAVISPQKIWKSSWVPVTIVPYSRAGKAASLGSNSLTIILGLLAPHSESSFSIRNGLSSGSRTAF